MTCQGHKSQIPIPQRAIFVKIALGTFFMHSEPRNTS
jgi:hypothetical protein